MNTTLTKSAQKVQDVRALARCILGLLFCFGLVSCTAKIPPEKERAAEAKAQKALLGPEEFYDLEKARKLETKENFYRRQSS